MEKRFFIFLDNAKEFEEFEQNYGKKLFRLTVVERQCLMNVPEDWNALLKLHEEVRPMLRTGQVDYDKCFEAYRKIVRSEVFWRNAPDYFAPLRGKLEKEIRKFEQ